MIKFIINLFIKIHLINLHQKIHFNLLIHQFMIMTMKLFILTSIILYLLVNLVYKYLVFIIILF